jgi:hypothetical protein
MVTACSTLQALPVRTPTYYVDFGAGSDTADGKSKTTAFQHAPGDANATGTAQSTALVPGDVVLLEGGVVYEGTITVTASGTSTQPIVLEGGPQEGWGSGMAIVDGQNTRSLGIGVQGASYVIVEGFEVRSFDKTQGSTGISVDGGSNDEIVGNVLHDIYYATDPTPGDTSWEQQRGTGISVNNSSGSNVYANSVRDCGNAGISLSADAASVTGGTTACNEVTNMNWGIVVALGDSTAGTHIEGLTIAHNYIHDFDQYVVCDAWHRDGIFVFARPDDGTLTIDDIEIADNYFEDTLSKDFGSTAWIYIEYVCRGFHVHHNILTNTSDTSVVFLNAGPAESPGSGTGVEELSLVGAQGQGFEKHGYAADPIWSVPFASISSDPSGFSRRRGPWRSMTAKCSRTRRTTQGRRFRRARALTSGRTSSRAGPRLASGSWPRQLGGNRRQEVLIGHRLGDVAIAAGGSNALFVALHRERSERDHRNGAGRFIPLEYPRGLQAVHAGELDVHQDEGRLLLPRELQTDLRVRRLEHGVTRGFQQEDRQRHVGGIVFDDEDLGHVSSPAGGPRRPGGLRS